MSAIADVMGRLDDALRDADQLIGVQVSYGWPLELETEAVWQTGPDPTDTQWVTLGENQRDDFFSLGIQIQIRRIGDGARESAERAAEVLDVLYEVVAQAGTFAGLLLMPPTPTLGAWRGPFGTPEGYVTQIELNLRCRARS